mmetsp:Transcript_51481/g.168331  ORF Transcript_51481/g.168331 Transcript_51481/m.168331 type:complete len:109 (+) Transcript_51481:61-387(+)
MRLPTPNLLGAGAAGAATAASAALPPASLVPALLIADEGSSGMVIVMSVAAAGVAGIALALASMLLGNACFQPTHPGLAAGTRVLRGSAGSPTVSEPDAFGADLLGKG